MNGNPEQGKEKPPEKPSAAEEAAASVAKKGLKKGAKKVGAQVVKQGGKLAGKLALRETISNVAAALTVATGPLAPILAPIVKALAWVATWIAEKVISKIVNWFRRHKEDIAIALLLGGAILGSPIILGAGIIATGAFGPTLVMARVGTAFRAFLSFYTAQFLPSIAIPLIVSFIVTVLAITLIIFIINSGAYVVPEGPRPVSALVENPYIGIEKLATRPPQSSKCTETDVAPGEQTAFIDCENVDLSFTIEYTITIEAKRGTLTNISLEHECTVIREGFVPNCPSPLPDIPALISPAELFTFTYSATYGGSFTDSLVIDAFTITADVESEGVVQTQAISNASIRIGEPPDQCPQGWPVGGLFWQGAYTGDTHSNAEAIDISGNEGASVTARHSGLARVESNDIYFGNNVEIVSICPETQFFSRYAHFSSTLVNSGDFVSLGQVIGEVGSTGNSTGPHLHYEFRDSSGPKGLSNPPNMLIPYIPQNLPRGCVGFTSCGSIIIP